MITTYKNKKNKKEYTLISDGNMKVTNAWLACIIYKNAEGKTLVREKNDFLNKFMLV